MLVNLCGLLLVIGTIGGIKMMSSPKTAARGNLLGAVCMTGLIIITLVSNNIISLPLLFVGLIVGSIIGCIFALKVAMVEMPQMVALFNGFGGGSSAIVSLLVLVASGSAIGFVEYTAAGLGLAVGAVTLSGSLVAAAKLSGKMSQRPTIFKHHSAYQFIVLLVIVSLIIPISFGSRQVVILSVLTLLITLFFGVLFTIRVGGADMPITISLLNAFSGLAASISGFAINDPVLIAVGGVVGSSGVILTRIMCKAMNRSLIHILTGKTVLQSGKTGDSVPSAAGKGESGTKKAAETDLAAIIAAAKKIIIVPGYGMALAQAQVKVKQLVDRLEEKGKELKFAIHPVAGRMPGHMNVLLAEVDIDYDKLYELEKINPEFKESDLVIVIGANDVINPAANTAEGTPIYGMPILEVADAKNVIIMNMDTKPGYAGVENPLYESEGVTLLLGDANESLTQVLELI